MARFPDTRCPITRRPCEHPDFCFGIGIQRGVAPCQVLQNGRKPFWWPLMISVLVYEACRAAERGLFFAAALLVLAALIGLRRALAQRDAVGR